MHVLSRKEHSVQVKVSLFFRVVFEHIYLDRYYDLCLHFGPFLIRRSAMTSQATNHGSAIFRYRPGIIAVLVVAVGCTGYYIHTTLSASSISKPVANGRLKRSNAVRRGRHPRPNDPLVKDRDDQSLLSSPIWRSAFHYGDYTAFDSYGRAIKLNLINLDLISAPRLATDFGISYRDAVRIREEVEAAFLDAFFARAMPVGPIIHIPENFRQIIVEKLGSCNNLSPANIEDALDRYANGVLEDHPNRIERREYAYEEGQQYQQFVEQLPEHNEPTDRYLDPSNEQSGPSTTEEDLGFIRQPHGADDGRSGVDDQQPSAATDQGNIGETTHQVDLPPETIVSLSEHDNGHDQRDHKKQTALSLLYSIAEEKARNDGYVHRGVKCNSCSALPIRGIRYRCTNCADYDNCELCESQQVHDRTHLFYKVRIPAPFLGRPRKPQPVWYPGKPRLHDDPLIKEDKAILCQLTGVEEPQLDALWEQFKCLASVDYPDDRSRYYLAIDRATFDRCFIPRSTARPPPPNLVYDRIFSFYDTNDDGLIGFHEFVSGIQFMTTKEHEDRLRQIFNGFDMDNDNFIARIDVQRMFKALFNLHKELAKDIIIPVDDDDIHYDENAARDIVNGSQALSSAFSGLVGSAEPSRLHEGKKMNEYGDFVIIDDSIEPVKPEDSMLRHWPEEQDYGQEILYDVIHDSINELLDPLFKFREDVGLEVLRTKADRCVFSNPYVYFTIPSSQEKSLDVKEPLPETKNLTRSSREKCQVQLSELRKAGLWIGMEYLMNQYHENWVSKGGSPNDKVFVFKVYFSGHFLLVFG